MKVKFKKLNSAAVTPTYAKSGDGCLDLTAITRLWDSDNKIWEYDTGVAVEIPEGYIGLVFPRSSIFKYDLMLSNSVGIIDSGYRNSIKFKYRQTDRTLFQNKFEVDERIGQLLILPYPKIELEEVKELSNTERGNLGFGSSGKK